MTLFGNRTGRSRFALILLGAMATAGPAAAQDYLGIHLDTMREHNLRLHQQQNASPGRTGKSPASKPKSGKMSPQAEARARAEGARIMEEHKRQLAPRYRMRVERDGKPSADRWLAEESRRLGIETGRKMRAKYSGQ